MKIQIDRLAFLKSWQMAERTSSTKSTIGALSGILVTTGEEKTLLEATDFKTAIRCSTDSVRALSSGCAILPVKLLSELFKKISTEVITIEVNDEKGTLTAGRNKTRFTTWPVADFPSIPRSDGAQSLCEVMAVDLAKAIAEGSIASSLAADFPKYLGACMMQVEGDELKIVSTDGRRLSLAKCPCENGSDAELLLPVTALRELNRLLFGVEPGLKVKILFDGSLTWFQMGDVEFSVRRVESSFPNYEKILTVNSTTSLQVSKNELLSVLDRLDVVVRNYTRLVVMRLSPGGQMELTGKAPEFGTALEFLNGIIDGEPLRVGFNVNYLQDGLKALDSEEARMEFNGEEGQMRLFRSQDENFLYMLMPNRLTQQDFVDPEEDFNLEEAASQDTSGTLGKTETDDKESL